jgi:hypothetical protein
VSRTALTATSQISTADVAHGFVYFALGGSLLRVVHGTDALANLLGEEAQPEARRQHALQDAHLSVLGQRGQPPPQFGDLGVVCLGWEAHGSSLLRVGPNFMGVRRLDLVRQPGALRRYLERTTAMCAATKEILEAVPAVGGVARAVFLLATGWPLGWTSVVRDGTKWVRAATGNRCRIGCLRCKLA